MRIRIFTNRPQPAVGARQSVVVCDEAILTEHSVGDASRLVVRGPSSDRAVEAVAGRVSQVLADGISDLQLRWVQGP